jgi:hypothetical protein
VRISLPPMMSGMSTTSAAIAARRAFRDTFSGDPGAYDRIGSFTAGITLRIPEKSEAIGAPFERGETVRL